MRRGFIGLRSEGATVPQRLVLQHDLKSNGAVRVLGVEPNGPSAEAGLKINDLIFSFDNESISGADDMVRLLNASRVGKIIPLSVLRGVELRRFWISPRERTSRD